MLFPEIYTFRWQNETKSEFYSLRKEVKYFLERDEKQQNEQLVLPKYSGWYRL